MTEEDNEDEQLRWETEMQTSDEAKLRSTVEMLLTALEVAMKRHGPMSTTEAQLIRSALLIGKENLGQRIYSGALRNRNEE